MKCKVFSGAWYQTMDAFNEWAKGKALTKDVIVHSLAPEMLETNVDRTLMIVVFYPEGSQFDTEA